MWCQPITTVRFTRLKRLMSNCEYGQKLADAEFGGGDDPPKQMISVSESVLMLRAK